jgi:mRNA interferase RelE/StbE
MPVYEVLLSKAARKALASFPGFIHNKIVEDISHLSVVPRPVGCIKLKGYKNAYRIRVGDYRVIYEIEDKVLRILIVAIGNRKNIYEPVGGVNLLMPRRG